MIELFPCSDADIDCADWETLMPLFDAMMADVDKRPTMLQLLREERFAAMHDVETAKLLRAEPDQLATDLGHLHLSAAAAAGDKGAEGASVAGAPPVDERIGSCRRFGGARRLRF
jgi:hypothetical protein